MESVEEVILEAVAALDVISDEPAPKVRARGFGISSVTLSVRVWHKSDLGSASEAQDRTVRAVATGLDAHGMGLANAIIEVHLPGRQTQPTSDTRGGGAR